VTPGQDADLIVVGAGPAGSATAYHAAAAGLDVLLLEKAQFPREKVCGDGLTPRGVRGLLRMGIDTSAGSGWVRNRGLRVIAAGLRLELPWPQLADWPDYGLVRPRTDLDELLATTAKAAGARLHERTQVTGPLVDERTDRVAGVRATGPAEEPLAFRAPLVVAADGGSARLALARGIPKRDDRPLGVAIRRYYTSPRTSDDYLESHLELWGREASGREVLLPGYGWVFGLGDGTSNVGCGLLNTAKGFRDTNYRQLLRDWLASLPPEWGFTEDNAVGPMRSGALPMGFNRTPAYRAGLLLVGDAGGVVNPFNGEGIAYAMESGELAAEVVATALAQSGLEQRERALRRYPQLLRERYGGYYTLGRMFVHLLGMPEVMRVCSRHGLPHPVLMRFVLKLLANLYDERGGDALDRIIHTLTRLAPAAA
jgi:geranylgeranyl reductase family protein